MYALYCMYVFYVHKFALNVFLRFREITDLLYFMCVCMCKHMKWSETIKLSLSTNCTWDSLLYIYSNNYRLITGNNSLCSFV